MFFGKSFTSKYEGSMVGSGPWAYLVLDYAITCQDFQGHVMLNPTLLALKIGPPFTKEQALEGIEKLMQPDETSTSKEEGGRRLVHLEGFWYRLVNGPKYRQIKSEAMRRETVRQATRRWRDKKAEEAETLEAEQPTVTPAPAATRRLKTSAVVAPRKVLPLPAAPAAPPAPAEKKKRRELKVEVDLWRPAFEEMWIAIYGAAPNKYRSDMLRPTVTARGWAAVEGPLRAYLAETSARYVNLTTFGESFGEWQAKAEIVTTTPSNEPGGALRSRPSKKAPVAAGPSAETLEAVALIRECAENGNGNGIDRWAHVTGAIEPGLDPRSFVTNFRPTECLGALHRETGDVLLVLVHDDERRKWLLKNFEAVVDAARQKVGEDASVRYVTQDEYAVWQMVETTPP